MSNPAEQPNFLDMSDEEMMNAPPPEAVVVDEAPVVVDPEVEPVVVEDAAAVPETEEDPAEAPEAKAEAEGTEADKPGAEGTEADAKKDDKVVESTKEEETPVDYEAEYKRLLAPFKANGRDISPKSIDDAISLMQMGANYNKKMAALKPNLKLMKLLENNGLLNEDKLSYLIELDKKSPEAINKLVQDSGLNPMDFDAEKADSYKPKIHSVDDRELDLDTVLDEISNTPTYSRTLEIVSKEWDGASKHAIAETPQLLKVINDHVERGIYDIINAEVDRERVFGRLNGMSDIEAYRQVGDAIQARGGFNHLGNNPGNTTVGKPVVVAPKPKVDPAILNDKRRAASPTKAGVTNTTAEGINPLSMSDAEFMKMAAAR